MAIIAAHFSARLRDFVLTNFRPLLQIHSCHNIMVILTNQIVSNTSCDSQQCSIFAKIAKDGDIF